jgi:hypothetical protein
MKGKSMRRSNFWTFFVVAVMACMLGPSSAKADLTSTWVIHNLGGPITASSSGNWVLNPIPTTEALPGYYTGTGMPSGGIPPGVGDYVPPPGVFDPYFFNFYDETATNITSTLQVNFYASGNITTIFNTAGSGIPLTAPVGVTTLDLIASPGDTLFIDAYVQGWASYASIGVEFASASVPEPNAIVLLLAMLAGGVGAVTLKRTRGGAGQA